MYTDSHYLTELWQGLEKAKGVNMSLYTVEKLPRWAITCQWHIHTVLWRNDIWGIGVDGAAVWAKSGRRCLRTLLPEDRLTLETLLPPLYPALLPCQPWDLSSWQGEIQ